MALKSITLGPGDCVTLPKNVVISSIVINGSITATSNCTLPTPTAYACGVFYFFIDDTGDDDTAMEEEYVYYNKVTVGNSSFIINEVADNLTEAAFNLHISDLALFEVKSIQYNTETNNRKRIAVYFQTPADLFDSAVLQLSDRGTLYNLPAYAATCEEYPQPE